MHPLVRTRIKSYQHSRVLYAIVERIEETERNGICRAWHAQHAPPQTTTTWAPIMHIPDAEPPYYTSLERLHWASTLLCCSYVHRAMVSATLNGGSGPEDLTPIGMKPPPAPHSRCCHNQAYFWARLLQPALRPHMIAFDSIWMPASCSTSLRRRSVAQSCSHMEV